MKPGITLKVKPHEKGFLHIFYFILDSLFLVQALSSVSLFLEFYFIDFLPSRETEVNTYFFCTGKDTFIHSWNFS